MITDGDDIVENLVQKHIYIFWVTVADIHFRFLHYLDGFRMDTVRWTCTGRMDFQDRIK